MSKVDILRLDSVTASDTTATASINTNFKNIQDTIETLLSRDGATPNYMQAVLDMNSNRIINTADPVDPLDVVNLKYVQETLGDLTQYVTAAQNAATAAEAKAQSAASSATAAASSAQAAIIASQQAVEAEGHIEQMLQDPNLVAVGEDLRSPDSKIEAAIDAAEQMLSIGYGTDLSYSNDTLQLLDQNGDALGNPVTIEAGGDYKGIWDATKNYKVGDIVAYNPQSTYQNIFYMCYQDNPVSAPTGMGWSRITEDHLVTVEPRQDNSEYRLGLIDGSITQRYQTDLRFSVNAPKVNAQTGELIGYATTTYVDNIVGDVEALLHSINTGA